MSTTLDRIRSMAETAGFDPEDHHDSIVVKLAIAGGARSQTIFITESGHTPTGETVIAFTSPCQRLAKGFIGGMSKKQALDLLRRNAALPFAAFALVSGADDEMLCVRSTLLLETLDYEEFKAAAECVAAFADPSAAEHGRDDF